MAEEACAILKYSLYAKREKAKQFGRGTLSMLTSYHVL